MSKQRAVKKVRAATLAIWSVLSVAVHAGALLLMQPGAAAANVDAQQGAIELVSVAPVHARSDSVRQSIAVQDVVPDEPSPSAPLPANEDRREIAFQTSPSAEPEYLTASHLSRQPVLLDSIEVPYPDVGAEAGDVRLVLTLYINELGTVDNILVDDSGVPAAFADAARQAFASGRFTPGRTQDTVVRSQVRIEVTFSAVGPGADAPAD